LMTHQLMMMMYCYHHCHYDVSLSPRHTHVYTQTERNNRRETKQTKTSLDEKYSGDGQETTMVSVLGRRESMMDQRICGKDRLDVYSEIERSC